jgi:NAD(P)-dependent dehydrogenase (short-subunit alcohol dehydrogenase family)
MSIVAITGGGQGIGRAIAYHFASQGYAVSITDSDRAAGEEAVKHMRARGAEALFVPGDVGREKDCAHWFAKTEKALGVPGVLVNNAGIMKRVPFLKLAVKDFDRVLDVNLRAMFVCAQIAARGMAKAKIKGAIVNIASTRALMSEPDTEAYATSKGGIVALTHAMAMSLAKYRIRVNAISPGWIEVADWKKAREAKTPHHSKADKEQHAVGRVGVPQDIAEACFFLAEHAGFVTGANLVVDGGMTRKMIYAE